MDCFDGPNNCHPWYISDMVRFILVILLPLILIILCFLLILICFKQRHRNRIDLEQHLTVQHDGYNIHSSAPPPYNWHAESPPPPPYRSK